MNIFILHEDIHKNAEMLHNKHCVKIILESTQILCNCHNQELVPYKRTHYNHPCCVWSRQTKANYEYLKNYAYALCKEYTYRYKKIHKCEKVLDELPIFDNSVNILTDFVQCMPDEYKVQSNAVQAYRNYYIAEKLVNASWKDRQVPEIFVNHITVKEKIK